MNTKLLVYGSYDRFNYGDLLFPHIIECELSKYYDKIEFYALVDSDLSHIGGKKTIAIKHLYNNDIKCDIIIAGGECLFTSWGLLYGFISSWFSGSNFVWKVLYKLIGENKYSLLRDKISIRILKGRTIFPFCINKYNFKNINNVYYNSVGCTKEPYLISTHALQIRKTLTNVEYLSVRDKKSHTNLTKQNIKTYLFPDSAILMSKHFSIAKLEKLISPEINEFVKNNKKYCFFQVNEKFGIRYSETITEQLEKLADSSKLEICLCPIGLALGHLDQKALSLINNKITRTHYYFEKVSIWDIMFLIANSSLYIGTSLHGVITAMSYNIPYVGIKIDKVNYYLQTWAIPELNQVIDFKDISKAGTRALKIDKNKLEINLQNQTKEIEDSFKHIIEIFKHNK